MGHSGSVDKNPPLRSSHHFRHTNLLTLSLSLIQRESHLEVGSFFLLFNPPSKMIFYIPSSSPFLLQWQSWYGQHQRPLHLDLEKSLLPAWAVNQRVTGSIPSQGTCLGCEPGPQWGPCERQPHIDISLPLSLPSQLSLKINFKNLFKT